ncbi:flagellar basal body L-ring protein FlgH [Bdellovibrionota bacterium FG-2]
MNALRLSLVMVTGVFFLGACANLAAFRGRGDEYADSDSGTYGGSWDERGFMSEGGANSDDEPYYSSQGRGLASEGSTKSGSRSSWVSPSRQEANRRDGMRRSGGSRGGTGGEETAVSSGATPVLEPATKRLYKSPGRATRSDFIDESDNEGSLWASSGQTNYYFLKNKVRSVGDIVTVKVEPELVRDVNSEVKKTLTPLEKQLELARAQDRIRAKILGLEDPNAEKDKDGSGKDGKEKSKDVIATAAAAPARAPAEANSVMGDKKKVELEMPRATVSDIDLSKSLEIKADDTMMGEITERFPNGNYKVRAIRKVAYKGGGTRLVSLVGIVKGSDINEEDVVTSGKLYEYRLEAVR